MSFMKIIEPKFANIKTKYWKKVIKQPIFFWLYSLYRFLDIIKTPTRCQGIYFQIKGLFFLYFKLLFIVTKTEK